MSDDREVTPDEPDTSAPMVEPEPTQPAELVAPVPPTQVLPTDRLPADAAGEPQREALDELFGEQSFKEYDDALIPAARPMTRRAARAAEATGTSAPAEPAPPRERAPLSRNQKVLLWVAGALVAALALVAIFVVGMRIPLLLGPAPGAEPSPTPSASPSPTPTTRPIGPVAPGEYRWDELWGGECLEPFENAWADEFTVVDCAEPHAAQLVLRAPVPPAAGSEEQGPYPGEEALAAQMLLLCSAAGVIDLAAVGSLTDVVVQGAFPVTEEPWDDGDRDYFCFVSRSSGEPLVGSVAVAPVAPVD